MLKTKATVAAALVATIIIASCASCASGPPVPSSEKQPLSFRCSDYYRTDFTIVESVYIEEWARTFGPEKVMLVAASIDFVDVHCQAVFPYSQPGRGVLQGFLDDNGDIHIATFDPSEGLHVPLAEGAYAHELTHLVLRVIFGNADGCPSRVEDCPYDDEQCFVEPLACDHAKGEGPWTPEHSAMIERVKERSAALTGR